MKDWRGTEIEVGSKVVAHGIGKFPHRAIGRVSKLHNGSVTVDTEEVHGWSKPKKIVLGALSVTVLTKDMFGE